MNQVAGNEELLDTTRDCFYLATQFFEPINVSATHIYHSALELSPPSIIRRLYYHQRHNPFPRVVYGGLESWDKCTHHYGAFNIVSYTWSPCGRFVAMQTQETVEIRDAFSSEPLSTLTSPDPLVSGLAYSPDGCSLACFSSNTLVIWDIQTGGVTKEIRDVDAVRNVSPTWSLDGKSVGTILWPRNNAGYIVYVYDVASGEPSSSVGPFWSHDQPYLWAHGTSFRVMTMRLDDQVYTIKISEVGSVLTKTESFCIKLRGQYDSISISSFSPTTYRISISGRNNQTLIVILDVRSSERMLEGGSHCYGSHSFSPDGSLFAIHSLSGVYIWKYTSSRYTPWRELPIRSWTSDTSHLQFSPTLSSILVPFIKIPQVWRLDGPSIVTHPNSPTLSVALSHCGNHIATWHQMDSTITITNPHSQTPPHFIDTGMKIDALAFTGDILLVLGQKHELVAWRLTEGGVVDGIFADRGAGRGDSIWTVSIIPHLRFSFEDQVTIIEGEGNVIHVYHMGTGEVLDPTRASPHSCDLQYNFWEITDGRHYPHYRELHKQGMLSKDDWPVSETTLQDGWVKDSNGKHRLWIPVGWRTVYSSSSWLLNITTLRLECKNRTVIIMF